MTLLEYLSTVASRDRLDDAAWKIFLAKDLPENCEFLASYGDSHVYFNVIENFGMSRECADQYDFTVSVEDFLKEVNSD